MSMARAVAAANERARGEGIEVKQSLVSVTDDGWPKRFYWRINYGPRNYVGHRGGDLDLVVKVGLDDPLVRRVFARPVTQAFTNSSQKASASSFLFRPSRKRDCNIKSADTVGSAFSIFATRD